MDFVRDSNLARLRNEQFDVLVVGGGITGLGVALDAASRGLSVGLVEKDDFSSGTSSKSSKLIHGGLRYLQQGEIGLVYEALHERQRLVRNAPHLVNVLPFMIPILTRDGVISKKIARALGSALWMYDLTGGWRIGKLHRRLKSDEAFAHMPTMNKEKLAVRTCISMPPPTTQGCALRLHEPPPNMVQRWPTIARCKRLRTTRMVEPMARLFERWKMKSLRLQLDA